MMRAIIQTHVVKVLICAMRPILHAALQVFTEVSPGAFIAQLPMHTNVRVITTRLGWRILHVGGVNGHLHLISWDSYGGHLVCGRSCATVVPGIYLHATTSITVSTEEREGRTPVRAC